MHRNWKVGKESLANTTAADQGQGAWPKPPCQANADAPQIRKPIEDVSRLAKKESGRQAAGGDLFQSVQGPGRHRSGSHHVDRLGRQGDQPAFTQVLHSAGDFGKRFTLRPIHYFGHDNWQAWRRLGTTTQLRGCSHFV